ncbi:hypothetical protein BKA62DRAFT_704642, partial [Auriculariales sp. MPI-PUGE-AT-0066]
MSEISSHLSPLLPLSHQLSVDARALRSPGSSRQLSNKGPEFITIWFFFLLLLRASQTTISGESWNSDLVRIVTQTRARAHVGRLSVSVAFFFLRGLGSELIASCANLPLARDSAHPLFLTSLQSRPCSHVWHAHLPHQPLVRPPSQSRHAGTKKGGCVWVCMY